MSHTGIYMAAHDDKSCYQGCCKSADNDMKIILGNPQWEDILPLPVFYRSRVSTKHLFVLV